MQTAALTPSNRSSRVAENAPAHLVLHDISKRFGGVQAVAGVSLRLERGRVHALVGENGAGKSTLGRIVAGAIAPDTGVITVNGAEISFRAPRDALAAGITAIAQELALLPARNVLDNVFLGFESLRRGRVDRRAMLARFQELMDRTGFALDPEAFVRDLRTADQQKVEILRALARDAGLIVMDEPTAALNSIETKLLLTTVRKLARDGSTIVFVSHFLRDVLEVADDVSVLQDGRLVLTAPAAEQTEESLVTAMLGRPFEVAFPKRPAPPGVTGPALEVRGLSTVAGLETASLHVRPGEIVGIAGLVGSGRSELLHGIFGADARTTGSVALAGVPVPINSPAGSMRYGLSLLPESRKEQGLILGRSVRENITLPHLARVAPRGVIRRREERRRAEDMVSRLAIKTDDLDAPLSALSGGNQQKVLFARCLMEQPRVLLADEPTRGVDVAAKRAIYDLIYDLARGGMGIVFVSSEIEEVLELSHRVLVMRAGRIVREFEGDQIGEESVMRAAFATNGGSV
jgi:rhamnose transport system ATP-binding protein